MAVTEREEFKDVAVFPCKFKVLPNLVFNSRAPIVAGVKVEAGVVKQGTPICVPSKQVSHNYYIIVIISLLRMTSLQFTHIGIVTSIQDNHKEVETARKGQEVCVKIEPIPGEAPKLFGRHFDETDMLVSKVMNSLGCLRFVA